MKPKWQTFDKRKGFEQSLPIVKRAVLVCLEPKPDQGLPESIAIGYLKFAAGDLDCPYFVVPGVGGEVSHWADCLGDDFEAPVWVWTDNNLKGRR